MTDKRPVDIAYGCFEGQVRVIKTILTSPAPYHSIRASRQYGKTYMLRRLAIGMAIRKKNNLVGYFTPTHRLAGRAYDEILNMLAALDMVADKNKAQDDRYIKLKNGSVIYFMSVKVYDNLRGTTIYDCICDEFAYFPDGAWSMAIKPMMNTAQDPKIVFSSTPQGDDDFHKYCQLGMSDNPKYQHYKLLYTESPIANLDFIEEERQNMSEIAWKQEYMAEFVFGSSAVFGDFKKVQLVEKFITEPEKGRTYFFGIDWATGKGLDATVFTLVDDLGKVCNVISDPSEDMFECARTFLYWINKFKATGYSEENGPGEATTQFLTKRSSNVFKYRTGDKTELVNSTISGISRKEIQLPTSSLCPKLDNEMSIYTAKRTNSGKVTYGHPTSTTHDDYVDSLMMAMLARKRGIGESVVLPDIDYDSIDTDIYSIGEDGGFDDIQEYDITW